MSSITDAQISSYKKEYGEVKEELNEPVLEPNYPVNFGFWYVADGQPVQSEWQGTVSLLKRQIGAVEIRRCDIYGRRQRGEVIDAI